MNKTELFTFPPERKSEADYFLNAFPNMPDKAGLFDAVDAISFMSDEGFVYYLPFLMQCLLEDAYRYDRLSVTVEVNLKNRKLENEEKYKASIALANQQMTEVNMKYY